MRNELYLTGKVLNSHISTKTGALVIKIAVTHKHFMLKGQIAHNESVFTVLVNDEQLIRTTKLKQGDEVSLKCYLNVDHMVSLSGNDHPTVKIYCTEIENQKSYNRIVDSTRVYLGI